MVSYKQFCKNKFLILLEDRFEDNYWFKLSYQQLIVYIRNGKIPLEKSLILVTKDSESSSNYKDEFKYPVTIFCEKEKMLDFIKEKHYKTSLSKSNIFSENLLSYIKEEDQSDSSDDHILSDEEIQSGNSSDQTSNETDSSSEDGDNDILSDEDILSGNDTESEKPSDSEEDTSSDNEKKTPEEEPPPDEISINEDSLELDTDIITGLEVNFKKMINLLDADVQKIAKILNLKLSFTKNKTDQSIRQKIKQT